MTRRYLVRAGDTFSKIANSHGISIQALSAANPHIKQISRIFTGQHLIYPIELSASRGNGKNIMTILLRHAITLLPILRQSMVN